MRAPPLSVASTTTVTSDNPAMMRLRTGNAYCRGCVPYASSLRISPDARTRS
jgi:hypothetical protein